MMVSKLVYKFMKQRAKNTTKQQDKQGRLWRFPGAKVLSDILAAVQDAHNQHAIGLGLVENHMAALHKAVQAWGV
jgi:poly-D-alanine transfer protein DltD